MRKTHTYRNDRDKKVFQKYLEKVFVVWSQKIMEIKPLSNNVVIEPIEEATTTASGIVLPDTAEKDKPQKGKIVSVGPGKMSDGQRIPMEIKVGDKVIFERYSPSKIKIDGKEYLLISESDILAIID